MEKQKNLYQQHIYRRKNNINRLNESDINSTKNNIEHNKSIEFIQFISNNDEKLIEYVENKMEKKFIISKENYEKCTENQNSQYKKQSYISIVDNIKEAKSLIQKEKGFYLADTEFLEKSYMNKNNIDKKYVNLLESDAKKFLLF